MYPNIQVLRRDVARRLRRGEHMVLYGPHGSGKTRLLIDLEGRMRAMGLSCALARQTRGIDDVRHALEEAYRSTVSPEVLEQTEMPERIWEASELRGGVLLLDHLTKVTNAMMRLLRRLHGIMGVLTAVDDEVETERPRLRPWRLSAVSIRLPAMSPHLLHQLHEERSAALGLPAVGSEVERRLISAAQGRPGWILACVQREQSPRYWQGQQLFVSLLCEDTDRALHDEVVSLLEHDDVPGSTGDEMDD